MNTIDANVNDEKEDKLRIFYDAFCGTLELNVFFSHINNLPSSIEERAKLDGEISDFDYFSKKYGVIQKGTAYYLVNDQSYIGKLTESTDSLDPSMIVTSVSLGELKKFSFSVSSFHSEIKLAIRKLVKNA